VVPGFLTLSEAIRAVAASRSAADGSTSVIVEGPGSNPVMDETPIKNEEWIDGEKVLFSGELGGPRDPWARPPSRRAERHSQLEAARDEVFKAFEDGVLVSYLLDMYGIVRTVSAAGWAPNGRVRCAYAEARRGRDLKLMAADGR
jgi:hypothetical protein